MSYYPCPRKQGRAFVDSALSGTLFCTCAGLCGREDLSSILC